MQRKSGKENDPNNMDIFSEDEHIEKFPPSSQTQLDELSNNMLNPNGYVSSLKKMNISIPYIETFQKEAYKELLESMSERFRIANREFFEHQKKYFDQKLRKIEENVESEYDAKMEFLEYEQGNHRVFVLLILNVSYCIFKSGS